MNAPAGYTALDLVGFTDKGVYNSATNYVQNDLVHYGGNIWRCLIDDTTNITPSEGLNWTLWIGEPTNLTEAIIAPLEVSPATDAHSVGDQLIYNDVLYKVISAISIGDSLTVGTNIEAARKIVYQISGIESDIATIEPTSIASKNYAVGEYMFYGWEFYRVTTAITAGDTIVTTGAGQNVTEVTVGGELTTANSHIEKQQETMRLNGAHNLLPILASDVKSLNHSGTWNGNVYTVDSMSYTLTVDDDGYVTQVLVNGSINATVSFHLREADNSSFSGMTLSGCPSGGSDSSYYLWIYPYGDTSTFYAKDTGNGDTIATLPTANTRVSIRIIGGTTVSNAVFKPMIRQASDTDKTYAPYAMTNQELTATVDKVDNIGNTTQIDYWNTDGSWMTKAISNLSQYRELMFAIANKDTGAIFNPVRISTTLFKTFNSQTKFVSARVALNSSTLIEMDVYYSSDTEIKFYGTTGYRFIVYGIK